MRSCIGKTECTGIKARRTLSPESATNPSISFRFLRRPPPPDSRATSRVYQLLAGGFRVCASAGRGSEGGGRGGVDLSAGYRAGAAVGAGGSECFERLSADAYGLDIEFRNTLEQARCGGWRKTRSGWRQARSATPPFKQRSYFQDALHELLKAREEPKFLGRFVEFRSRRSST